MGMTAVLKAIDQTNRKLIAEGTIELADAYVTKGDTLDLSKLGVAASQKPSRFEAWSEVSQGAAVLQDFYTYVPGNGLTDGKLQIAVAGAEMAAAAYAATTPCNATGYKLKFRAEFDKFI